MSDSLSLNVGSAVPLKRAREVSVQLSEITNNIGGSARVSSGRIQLVIPGGDNDYNAVVRLHELLHARHTPQRCLEIAMKLAARKLGRPLHPMAPQAYEDIAVHTAYWPVYFQRGAHANRQLASAVATDLDSIEKANITVAREYNVSLVVALRSTAAINHLYRYGSGGDGLWSRLWDMVNTGAAPMVEAGLVGDITCHSQYVVEWGEIVRNRRVKWWVSRAADLMIMLDALFAREGQGDEEESHDGEENGGAGIGGHDIKARHYMDIVELPLVAPTTSLSASLSPAPFGLRLRTSQMTQLVTGDFRKAFLRKAIRQGGTVLIDASGSMKMTREALEELCRSAPAATVAYYSSYSRNGGYGTLCVYAKGGRRAKGVDFVGGMNSVDLWAIRWLLKQQGPLYLVSDLGFCGGPVWQAPMATSTLRANKGKINVIGSCAEAIERFRAKRLL